MGHLLLAFLIAGWPGVLVGCYWVAVVAITTTIADGGFYAPAACTFTSLIVGAAVGAAAA